MRNEPKRARRRRHTLRVAGRRRWEHIELNHGGEDEDPTCVCMTARTYYAKQSGRGCGCRKRSKGRPRQGVGMCKYRNHIYLWRAQARDLLRADLVELDPDADRVSLLEQPCGVDDMGCLPQPCSDEAPWTEDWLGRGGSIPD